MTIVLAGGSGFLGRKLARLLEHEGHRTITLSRNPKGENQVAWQPDGRAGALTRHLDGVDAIVNLAGEGIADKRWTAARKEALTSSRILSTRTLVRAVSECAHPPKVFVSGSGIGYYGPHGDEPVTESTPPGDDFLARLCVEWEQEARMVESRSTRLAIVRTGIALDRDGGALKKMLLPFKLGLGASIGSGDQYMPWIHAEDWTAMVWWMISDDRASGAFNAAAPAPVTNRMFTRTLGRVLHRPAVLHAPAFMLRAALGELSSALIHGQRVLPAAAEQRGFRFKYRDLEPALASLNL
ncbi:MAG TPA: TIGR01777 family oxidoreductase [Vicinamibacterales bacterium]|nr:TIGR01777 family oxidoreductase [Vicinamibacterales bacterium]